MNAHGAFKAGISGGQHLVVSYLEDLSDADLLVRAVPGANHIAWQLGHLIGAENMMLEAIRPGSMPKLPAGFREKHTKETAKSDNPKNFLTKDEYLALAKEQRSGTLKVLESMSEADFDAPVPEPLSHYLRNVGDIFSMQCTHWVMHAGQWALIRRKLGRPPLF